MQTGSTDFVSRSRQKPHKVWTSGPVPSVPRPAAGWRRKSCTVCAVSLTMKGSMLCVFFGKLCNFMRVKEEDVHLVS